MFFDTRNFQFIRHNRTAKLEVGASTSLLYSLYNPATTATVDTVQFKLDKQSGRSKSSVIGWTDATALGTPMYQLDLDVPADSIKDTDNLLLTIKITETDGLESFLEDSEVQAV